MQWVYQNALSRAQQYGIQVRGSSWGLHLSVAFNNCCLYIDSTSRQRAAAPSEPLSALRLPVDICLAVFDLFALACQPCMLCLRIPLAPPRPGCDVPADAGCGEEHHPCDRLNQRHCQRRLRAGGAKNNHHVQHRAQQLHDVSTAVAGSMGRGRGRGRAGCVVQACRDCAVVSSESDQLSSAGWVCYAQMIHTCLTSHSHLLCCGCVQ